MQLTLSIKVAFLINKLEHKLPALDKPPAIDLAGRGGRLWMLRKRVEGFSFFCFFTCRRNRGGGHEPGEGHDRREWNPKLEFLILVVARLWPELQLKVGIRIVSVYGLIGVGVDAEGGLEVEGARTETLYASIHHKNIHNSKTHQIWVFFFYVGVCVSVTLLCLCC